MRPRQVDDSTNTQKKDKSIAARKAYSQHSSNIQPDDITNDVSQEHLKSLKQSFYDTKMKVDQTE